MQNAQHGSVSLDEFQKTLFIPDANYNGAASFTYTIADGHGAFSTATVSINIAPDNDAPTVGAPIGSHFIQRASDSFAIPSPISASTR